MMTGIIKHFTKEILLEHILNYTKEPKHLGDIGTVPI